MFSATVPSRVKRLRERARLSIREIAGLLDMSSSGYAHYENPARFKDSFLPVPFALRLAEVLARHGVPEDDVMALATADGMERQIARPTGFSEDHALPWIGQDGDRASADDMCRMLAPWASNPGSYEVRVDQPAFGLQAGDIIIVDRRLVPSQGELALGNTRDESGAMRTVIGRFFAPYLVTSDALATGQVIRTDGEETALYHPIVASFRRTRSS